MTVMGDISAQTEKLTNLMELATGKIGLIFWKDRWPLDKLGKNFRRNQEDGHGKHKWSNKEWNWIYSDKQARLNIEHIVHGSKIWIFRTKCYIVIPIADGSNLGTYKKVMLQKLVNFLPKQCRHNCIFSSDQRCEHQKWPENGNELPQSGEWNKLGGQDTLRVERNAKRAWHRTTQDRQIWTHRAKASVLPKAYPF